MIGKDELHRIAKTKRLSIENAEKDYVLDLLLFQIYGERSGARLAGLNGDTNSPAAGAEGLHKIDEIHIGQTAPRTRCAI